jgi:hypothetical protein
VVKDVKIYINWVKKKTCLGCFRIEEIRGKDNETGLKEGGGIEMSIYSCFPYTRCTLSFALKLLTIGAKNTKDNALSFIHVMQFRVRGQQRPPHDFPK